MQDTVYKNLTFVTYIEQYLFARLLNKSIIRVEQPDIHLDEEDPQYEPSMDVDQEIPNGTGIFTHC